MVRLRDEALALVASLEADPRYEVARLAPAQLQEAKVLAQRLEQEIEPRTASALNNARNTMRLLRQEIAGAIEVAARAKAAASVEQITAIHKRLRGRWAPFVRRGALANDMAAADKGYEAMLADFKAGRFEPIAEKADGFRLVLEGIEQAAARNWIEAMLMDGGVRRSLKEADIRQISLLQAQGQHLQAAAYIESKAGEAVRKAEADGIRPAPTPVPVRRAARGSRTNNRTSSQSVSRSSRKSRVVIEDAHPRR
jgi:hypothetical protein